MSAERRVKTKQEKDTMFLFFEGHRTELLYFEKIESMRQRVLENPSKLILKPIERDEAKSDQSHPWKVWNYLKHFRKWVKSNGTVCNYDLFLTNYLNAISNQTEKIKKGQSSKIKNVIYKKVKNQKDSESEYPNFYYYMKKLKKILEDKKAIDDHNNVVVDDAYEIVKNAMCNLLSPDYDYSVKVDDVLRPPKAMGYVRYGMIVDRDQVSFSEKSVEDIRKLCFNYKCKLVITNPNFELWLALHIKGYNKKEMMEDIHNLMVMYQDKRSKTQEEKDSVGPIKYIRDRYPEYKKTLTGIDFITEDGLRRAIDNLDSFHETDFEIVKNKLSPDDLSSVGSNILDIILERSIN